MPTEYVELELQVLVVRDQALRVTDGDVTCWLPLSQLTSNVGASGYLAGKSYTFELPEWLALKEELI